jgi:hypothetical protein
MGSIGELLAGTMPQPLIKTSTANIPADALKKLLVFILLFLSRKRLFYAWTDRLKMRHCYLRLACLPYESGGNQGVLLSMAHKVDAPGQNWFHARQEPDARAVIIFHYA